MLLVPAFTLLEVAPLPPLPPTEIDALRIPTEALVALPPLPPPPPMLCTSRPGELSPVVLIVIGVLLRAGA